MVMIPNYTDTPMIGLTATDYVVLVNYLHEQVVGCMDLDAYPEGEASKRAFDVLNFEWSDGITAREWLDRVGKQLGVDTSQCAGA